MPESLQIDDTLDPSLEGLEPKGVWYVFNQLRQIPRNSHKEAAVMQWIQTWAEGHGFPTKRDEVRNMSVYVPATPGYENQPPVVCQSHVDMVCEKEQGHPHNFDTDPIQLERYGENGEFIKAKGTTLGTDNGSAVCTFMAVAIDPDAIHPPLELLFTVDEEDTFQGAKKIDVAMLGLRGRFMINLDTSLVDKLCIGSGGYNDVHASLPVQRDASEIIANGKFYEISISGLEGGHSGDDIVKERGNPILMLNQIMKLLPLGRRLGSLDGGQKANAIPREAQCIVYVPVQSGSQSSSQAASWESDLQAFVDAKRVELKNPKIILTIKSLEPSGERVRAMTMETHDKIAGVLDGLPDGVLRFSEKIPGLPATSSNIGKVNTGADTLHAEICVRGAVTREMQEVASTIGQHLTAHGFEVDIKDPVPSWDENPDSDLIRLAAEAHQHVTGELPELTAFHSCLECGVIATKFPHTVRAVSMGPDNLDEHSPMERIKIKTLQISYDRLKYMLKRIADGALDKETSIQ